MVSDFQIAAFRVFAFFAPNLWCFMIQKVTTFFKWWKDWPPTFWVNLTRRSTRGKLGSVVITILEISVFLPLVGLLSSFDYIECRHFLREIWSPNLSKRQHFPQNWAGSHGTHHWSLWRTFIQRHHFLQLLATPKTTPTAPKKIPLKNRKNRRIVHSGVSRVSSTQVYNFTIFKRFFFGGPHLLLARCSGDVIFLGGFSPSPTNGCELHHQKMTDCETGKFSNVKSWPFKGWSCCRVDLHLRGIIFRENDLKKRLGWVEFTEFGEI